MGLFMCFGRVSGVGRNNNVCLIEAKKDVVEKIVSGSQDWWEDWRARPESSAAGSQSWSRGAGCPVAITTAPAQLAKDTAAAAAPNPILLAGPCCQRVLSPASWPPALHAKPGL